MMDIIIYTLNGKKKCRHYDKDSAEKAISRIHYTTKEGVECNGAHWTLDEVLQLTQRFKFKDCVTDYDKWVAFNAAYADFNKVLTVEDMVEAGFAFFFDDEDAPCDKLWRYMQSF